VFLLQPRFEPVPEPRRQLWLVRDTAERPFAPFKQEVSVGAVALVALIVSLPAGNLALVWV
jgi:hypothetical protein